MAVSQALLQYQTVDAKLREIERELSGSEERKKYIQAKKFIESAAEKLQAQDQRARELKALANKLVSEFEEITKLITEYSEIDEMIENGGDVSFYKKNVQSLLDRLRVNRAELNKVLSEIESICEEYQKLKSNTISMQRQYKEYNEKFKTLKNSRSDEVDEISKQLAQIAKEIPADVLAKYTEKRKAKIFPVIARLKDGRCICGMDLAIAQQGKLSGGGVIECEHCHRFIYKE